MNHYFETFMALFVIFGAVLVLHTKTTKNCFGNVNTAGGEKRDEKLEMFPWKLTELKLK